MKKLYYSLLVIITCLFSSAAIAGCEGSLPAGANRAINSSNIDQATFSAAVRYYTNVYRCRQGLPPVTGDRNLLSAAVAQGSYMARANNMSHNVGGAISSRFRSSGVSYRTAAENIAQNFLFAIVGRNISTARGGRCQFFYADNGQPVPQHSYNSLAAAQVASWMASSGHRVNILSSKVNRMEAGIGFAPDNATCGRLYISQNFAG